VEGDMMSSKCRILQEDCYIFGASTLPTMYTVQIGNYRRTKVVLIYKVEQK